MAQQFYVDNLMSRFVKCLLCDIYIPTVPIWKQGKNLIKDLIYITQDKYIVKAKKDFRGTYEESPKSALDNEYFDIIDNYVVGKFYRGLTSNFQSNSSLYDPQTHYALGQYLRFERDMNDLDLMAYYNCYSGINSDKIRFKGTTIEKDNKTNDGLISYIVPIKFNQDYTIYYNSEVPFDVLPVYYDGITITNAKNDGNNNLEPTKIRRCSMRDPYLFKGITFLGDSLVGKNSNEILKNNYLHLLIQVPKNKTSNLVVLEGDYTCITTNLNNLTKKDTETNEDIVIINSFNKLPAIFIGDDKKLSVSQVNDIFKPYPALIQNISDNNYAFSNRLAEYLLYSPIIKDDKIRFNIKRIQDCVSSNGVKNIVEDKDCRYKETYIPDIWSTNLRYYLYNLLTQEIENPLYKEFNGYVDKDSEFIIDKAKTKEGEWNV